MNVATPIKAEKSTGHTVCPHDCPSACALEVDVTPEGRIGRVRGASANTYTAGVICAKVARYSERIYHPGRLMVPQRRKGAKGEGNWQEITWEDALDEIASAFVKAEQRHGSEAVWPYFYAGTMGQVQRDSIDRLRHAKKYSGFFGSICTNLAWTGLAMATGSLRGPDPREMAKSDCVVIWGTNAVATQVNVMTHAIKARKERGAKIVVIDIYDNPTVKQADMGLVLKPGTDAALACAVMHIAFRDGYADRTYLAQYADDPAGLEAHLTTRTPQWASAITGLPVDEIEAFGKLVGTTPKTYFRLGYGFTRQRNGAVAIHAAASVPTVLGSWQYEGGGAFHTNNDIFKFDKRELVGSAMLDPDIRMLDQSQIGRVLTGDAEALRHRGPVTAMLIQNTNPVNVAPEQRLVKQGFLREDLFVAVHEQFMTDTAKVADIVLPATMFLEHDDLYRGGGHQHILLGPKVVEPPSTVRTNLFVIEELAKRLGVAGMPGFGLSERDHIDRILVNHGTDFNGLKREKWLDIQPDFDTAHFTHGFGHPDGKFRFKADWTGTPAPNRPPKALGVFGPHAQLPEFPDHVDLIEVATATHPFRLATSPARSFLNSTFAETPSSIQKEIRPEAMIHADDAEALGIAEGAVVRIGNERGEIRLHAKIGGGARRGVVIVEGLWPNDAHLDGEGINVLTGADAAAPYGGAAFHDNRVWMRKDEQHMTKFENAKVEILKDETLSKNWYHLRNITFNYSGSNGVTKTLKREVYDRGNGATILLYDPKRDSVILVRQFRVPTYLNGHSGWLLETPAGLLDGDHPAEAIKREVMEETGYLVTDVRPLFHAFMSPGAVTETVHFFAAIIDVTVRAEDGGGAAHEDEDIEVVEMPLADAMAMISSGEICDGKTIMLLQWAMLNRERLG